MRKLTILDTVKDIRKALAGKAYLSAFALALTIPDIMSKAEYPDIKEMGKRYRAWMNKYYVTSEEKQTRIDNLDITDELGKILNKLDGNYYAELRNAFLHSGNNDVDCLKEVDFEISYKGLESTSVCGYPEEPYLKRHILSISDFCMKMCAITESLIDEWKCDAKKLKILEKTGINLICLDIDD